MVSLNRWLDKKRNPWKAEFHRGFSQWRKDKASRRMLDYSNLPANAMVFDIGGFEGNWADGVLAHQPNCTVHIFEPHPKFAATLSQKFAGNVNVHIHAFALGAKDGTLSLSDEGDASSSVAQHGRKFEAPVVSTKRFFTENNITLIDLAKMNIEGGEYNLIPALVEDGYMSRINRLQVQFHLFKPDMIATRNTIRTQLEATHDCTWNYPFVWEEWQQKP